MVYMQILWSDTLLYIDEHLAINMLTARFNLVKNGYAENQAGTKICYSLLSI